ncbi:MAG: hypothetical protein JRI76_12410 [Deltaproteobacteria bacterium]|nr:hypothetical protein [Deltaproteobacteria bacterium]MBW1956478.1 hypothetical protein [Deltaproteobacteria bacterium]MBW2042813.1 hypothetical protein [Deltaproteobacteria bacterium]MBW2133431.1 hypothetical protein [Deltaproteobacteria bacterium]
MSNADPFRTETLARIYFSQGRFQEAADIYRYLILNKSGNRRLVPAFLEAEQKALEKRRSDVIEKTARWIRFSMRLKDRKRLAGVQRRYLAERSVSVIGKNPTKKEDGS